MMLRAIPEDTLIAIMAIMRKYAPEITPPLFVAAIRAYEPAQANGAAIERPMTVHEVGDILRVSVPTVYKLMREGRIRRVGDGMRRTRVDRKSVLEYLNK